MIRSPCRARDLGDLAPPRLGHDRGRRVVQRRDQVERLQPALAAGVLERVGPQAMGVERQPAQAQAQQPGDRLQAGVRERLRQQHVARLEQRREHDRQPVLAAGADQHLVGRDGEPRARDPRRARLAVERTASRRRIVEQPPHVAARRQAGERARRAPRAAAARPARAGGSGSGRRSRSPRPRRARPRPRARRCPGPPLPTPGPGARLRRTRGSPCPRSRPASSARSRCVGSRAPCRSSPAAKSSASASTIAR